MNQPQQDRQPLATMVFVACMILIVFSCVGCSTVVPVTQKFPEAPGNVAMTPCPQLQKLTEDAKLSDISKTVTVNYGTYYECAVKTDAWIEWYQKQNKYLKTSNEDNRDSYRGPSQHKRSDSC
jgi:hypothetical protein